MAAIRRPVGRALCYTVRAMSDYHCLSLAGDPETLGRLQAAPDWPRPQPAPAPRLPWLDDPAFLAACAQVLRSAAPAVWAELAAFADALGVDAPRALFLRAGALRHGCSAFAWRLADGQVVAGRTYDYAAAFPHRHLLDTRPSQGLAHLGMNGGMVGGRYDGVNERGLFVALHKVMAERPARVDPGLPPHLLVRAALETCADAAEAARLIAGLPHLAAFNYTLADPAGRLIALECYPGRPARTRWCARAVAVANHYAHPSLAPLQGQRPLAGSHARAAVMRRPPEAGADPWLAAQATLADHSAPVCAHRAHGSTLWAGVFDLTGRRVAYAFGAPCAAPFVARAFPGARRDAALPAARPGLPRGPACDQAAAVILEARASDAA